MLGLRLGGVAILHETTGVRRYESPTHDRRTLPKTLDPVAYVSSI